MNKIRTILILLMMISSVGIVQGATVSSEVKDGLVKISVSVPSTDEQRWAVYIDAKTDHGLGEMSSMDSLYPYSIERVTGTGNNEFTRMYPVDDYLVTLASRGIGTVDFSVFSVLPAPTQTPTPTPTPSPTPTPTPTPTPEPVQVSALVQPAIVHAAPAADFGSYQEDDGTLNFDSTPQGAVVYINRQKLGITPRSRDLTPGKYRIEFKLEGFYNFTKDVEVVEDKSIDINVIMEPIKPEKVPEVLVTVQVLNTTQIENVTVTTPTEKGTIPTLFYVISLVVMIVAVIVLGYVSKKRTNDSVATMSEDDSDSDTTTKVKQLLKSNPEYTNQELADEICCSVRTIERNIAKLKKEGRFPNLSG